MGIPRGGGAPSLVVRCHGLGHHRNGVAFWNGPSPLGAEEGLGRGVNGLGAGTLLGQYRGHG